jgi:hypothetical protein
MLHALSIIRILINLRGNSGQSSSLSRLFQLKHYFNLPQWRVRSHFVRGFRRMNSLELPILISKLVNGMDSVSFIAVQTNS